ncbi:MAG: O-antigen ligase family protein [Candidatus Moraniibacteriota bacterium]
MERTSFFGDGKRSELFAFSFLIILLFTDAFINAAYGFSLPVFVATLAPAAVLAFLYPRAGLSAALSTTIVFERFFTLVPMTVGEISYKLYPLDIILVATFLSTFLLYIRDGRRRFRFRSTDAFLLIFFGIVTVIFVSGLFGLGKDQGLATAFSTWKNYVFYGALYFSAATLVRTRDDVRSVARLFLGSVAVAGIFLLIGFARGGGLWTEYTPLSTSGTRFLAFPHAFYYSMALLTLLLSLPFQTAGDGFVVEQHPTIGFAHPYAFFRRAEELFAGRGNGDGALITERSVSYGTYAAIAFLTIGIVSSLMRHLWIGIAVTIVSAVLIAPNRIGKPLLRFAATWILPSIGLLLLCISVLVAVPETVMGNPVGHVVDIVKERVLSIGSGTDESLAWREAVWESALSRFSEHPFRGIGFGASVPVELGDYREYVEVRNMHNSWLAMLIQTGLFGMAAFSAFLVSLVKKAFRSDMGDDRYLQGARIVLLGLLLFQGIVFFSQPYLETNLLGLFFFVTLGLMRALPDMYDGHTAHHD